MDLLFEGLGLGLYYLEVEQVLGRHLVQGGVVHLLLVDVVEDPVKGGVHLGVEVVLEVEDGVLMIRVKGSE